jgi:hypothetical protein
VLPLLSLVLNCLQLLCLHQLMMLTSIVMAECLPYSLQALGIHFKLLSDNSLYNNSVIFLLSDSFYSLFDTLIHLVNELLFLFLFTIKFHDEVEAQPSTSDHKHLVDVHISQKLLLMAYPLGGLPLFYPFMCALAHCKLL